MNTTNKVDLKSSLTPVKILFIFIFIEEHCISYLANSHIGSSFQVLAIEDKFY